MPIYANLSRKVESDLFKSNCTVVGFTAVALFILLKSKLAPVFLASLYVNATSSASNGVLSVNLTSSLI